MDSTLAPDPFAALNLPATATSADIKTAYRKLALKCHPDKVADEALKKIKQEEFHKIQQAYELIGDDEKLEAYRAEVRLEAQRKAKFASRAASGPSATRYDVRTAAPTGSGAPYSTATPHRYEERKPTTSRSFEEDPYYKSRSKTYDTYEAFPKQSSSSRNSRPDKESTRPTRVSADRSRSERNKTRDKEHRQNRSDKFAHPDEDISSNDEKVRFEANYRKNGEDARVRDGAADLRRKATDERIKVEEAAARKKSESRRSYEEREPIRDPTKEPRRQRSDERELEQNRKTYDGVADRVAAARAHIHNTTHGSATGPSPSRTTSREVPHEPTHESRSRRDRPETARRSSARPRDRERLDRSTVPEIVDWARPSMTKSSSSPADIHLPPPRVTPTRAYTDAPRDSRRADKSPTPPMRRSETMPMPGHSSSSRREDYVPRSSTLRSSEYLPHSSSPPEGAHPSVAHVQPSSSSSKKYYYPSSSGVRDRDHVDIANGHPTTVREPNRRTRSPETLGREPISRPPIGPNRVTEAPPPPRPTAHTTPPLMRSQTFAPETERGRRLFGERLSSETTPEILRRSDVRRQNSHSPTKNVSYSRRIHPEDISFSRRGGPREEHFAKPSYNRSATVGGY